MLRIHLPSVDRDLIPPSSEVADDETAVGLPVNRQNNASANDAPLYRRVDAGRVSTGLRSARAVGEHRSTANATSSTMAAISAVENATLDTSQLLIAPRPNAALWRASIALNDESLLLRTLAARITVDAFVSTLFRAVCHRIEPRTVGQQSIERLLVLLGRRRSYFIICGLIAAELCARLHDSDVSVESEFAAVSPDPTLPTSSNSTSPPAMLNVHPRADRHGTWLSNILSAAITAERAVTTNSARTRQPGVQLGQTFARRLFQEFGRLLRHDSIIGSSVHVLSNVPDRNSGPISPVASILDDCGSWSPHAISAPNQLLALWMQTWNIPMELHPGSRSIIPPKPVREPICTT